MTLKDIEELEEMRKCSNDGLAHLSFMAKLEERAAELLALARLALRYG